MNDEQQNPIVAMAMKLRARRDLGAAIDSVSGAPTPEGADAETTFAALADVLAGASKRLNSILGKNGVTFIRLEKPLRIRLRFRDRRVALDLDRVQQLVRIAGCELDGEYQFDTSASVPTLINLSKLSTDAGYGEPISGNAIVKVLAKDAEIPRPAHLDATGPISL